MPNGGCESKFQFDPPIEEANKNIILSAKWSKFKHYVAKKRANTDLKDKRVYLDTLSVASVKRSFYRVYRRIFKSKYSGYDRFLTDEEKRLMFAIDHSVVEGVY